MSPRWFSLQTADMLHHRILLIVLLTCLMAHSQPCNPLVASGDAAASSTNPPQSLKILLSADSSLNISGGHSGEPTSDKAGIYSTKPVSSLKAVLLSVDPTLKITEASNGESTNLTCVWPEVTVRFALKTQWDDLGQRLGMRNWISSVPGGTNTPAVGALLHKVDDTVACIGSVVTPRYDSAGKASTLVLGLAAKLDGYVFSQKSFYASTGEKIIGVTNAPLQFKAQL